MTFLRTLREYLRVVERGEREPPSVMMATIDLPVARHYFLGALERYEGTEPSEYPRAFYWSREQRDDFVRRVESELREGMCVGANAETLQRHLHDAIDLLIGLAVEGLSAARRRELRHIVTASSAASEEGQAAVDVRTYAFENRLVRIATPRVAVSPVGRVLVGLPEPDAVRWLLLLETKQSLGAKDEGRMPIEALASILKEPHKRFSLREFEDVFGYVSESVEEWPFAFSGMLRLSQMNVVTRWEDPNDPEWGYNLNPAYRGVLEEIVSQQNTPWRVLADTLLAEERNAVPALASWGTSTSFADDGALALERHSRMVAHEIHNAMTPAQHALRKLYDALAQHAPDDSWRTYQQRVDRNIERTVRFATQMAETSTLATRPSEPFDLVETIRDALAELNGVASERISFADPGDLPPVRGHRHRFVMVVVNLLRNALQSSADRTIRVRVAVTTVVSGHVCLAVDDDGPGVPEQYREAIFQPNFSLRVEGHGQGLALVRDVVEGEMSGSVRCETSDMGGARFVLLLPPATRRAV